MFQKKATALEAELLEIASGYGFAPRPLGYEDGVLTMEAIEGYCLADLYTDDPTKITKATWEEIHRILCILYEREGIEYIDITSYNFMEDKKGKIWIIDFGHAYYTQKKVNWFLDEFLGGDYGWNPDFA